jgi:hypothetical protein
VLRVCCPANAIDLVLEDETQGIHHPVFDLSPS